jgi:transposase InsO family protein
MRYTTHEIAIYILPLPSALALSGMGDCGSIHRAMGIRDHPAAPRSSWQSGHVERLIGSIRRDCLDHFVVFGEAHLRRVLKAYGAYYNEVRTHRH